MSEQQQEGYYGNENESPKDEQPNSVYDSFIMPQVHIKKRALGVVLLGLGLVLGTIALILFTFLSQEYWMGKISVACAIVGFSLFASGMHYMPLSKRFKKAWSGMYILAFGALLMVSGNWVATFIGLAICIATACAIGSFLGFFEEDKDTKNSNEKNSGRF